MYYRNTSGVCQWIQYSLGLRIPTCISAVFCADDYIGLWLLSLVPNWQCNSNEGEVGTHKQDRMTMALPPPALTVLSMSKFHSWIMLLYSVSVIVLECTTVGVAHSGTASRLNICTAWVKLCYTWYWSLYKPSLALTACMFLAEGIYLQSHFKTLKALLHFPHDNKDQEWGLGMCTILY